ncbi:MAG: prepilin-type N-terminal cleavage/methylation domain-containing protein [Candidatus Omnitrophota bacterium]
MKKGFTLIELLLVVILIGILVTLLLPQLGSLIERIRTGEGRMVLGSMRSGLMAYKLEHNGAFPTAAADNIYEIETAIGGIIDDKNKSLFSYSWPAGSAADRAVNITITAVRNGTIYTPIVGGKTAFVTMVATTNGSANMEITWN